MRTYGSIVVFGGGFKGLKYQYHTTLCHSSEKIFRIIGLQALISVFILNIILSVQNSNNSLSELE